MGMKDAIQAHALFIPMLLLILLGAFTKSAQFPFRLEVSGQVGKSRLLPWSQSAGKRTLVLVPPLH
jgi:hypothetical protein